MNEQYAVYYFDGKRMVHFDTFLSIDQAYRFAKSLRAPWQIVTVSPVTTADGKVLCHS